jgi:hypothetical protein
MPSIECNGKYEIIKQKSAWGKSIDIDKSELKDAIRVAKNAFTNNTSDRWIARLLATNNLLLSACRKDTKTAVGFAASEYQTDECHFVTAFVAKPDRGNGIYYMLNKLRISDGLGEGFSVFTVTTQNPNVERGLLRAINYFIDQGSISSYSLTRELKRRTLPRMLTPDVPKCPDQNLNEHYLSLNHKKGDAFKLAFSVERRR